MVKLSEIQTVKKYYVGSCRDFDEDGYSFNAHLPYNTTQQLSDALENSEIITKEEFIKNANVPNDLQHYLKDNETSFMKIGNVYVMYAMVVDGRYADDIHFFFL